MNRRSFLRRLVAVFAAPSAVIAVTPPAATMMTTYLMGSDNIITGPHTRPKPVMKATIGQYADYVSMQWDVGNGYLDIPGSKKMGKLKWR